MQIYQFDRFLRTPGKTRNVLVFKWLSKPDHAGFPGFRAGAVPRPASPFGISRLPAVGGQALLSIWPLSPPGRRLIRASSRASHAIVEFDQLLANNLRHHLIRGEP